MGWYEVERILGLDDPGSPYYLFWSGFGGDVGKFALFGFLWHHINCDKPRCIRPRHAQTHYCRRHQPQEPPP